MKVRIPVILGVISVLTLSSCVSSKKYAQLQDRYDSLSKDYNQSQLDLTECNATSRNLQERLDDGRRVILFL